METEPRLLTREEVDTILSFIPKPTGKPEDFIRDLRSVDMRHRFEDELSEIKLIPGSIDEFRFRLRDNYVNAHSIIGDSMVRSAQNFAKTIVQKTISTKRGNDGKNEHISSVTTTKELLAFSKKRSVNRAWLWAAEMYDDEKSLVYPTMTEVEHLSKKIFAVSLKYLLKSTSIGSAEEVRYWDPVKRDGEFIILHLDISRMIHYEITMFDVVSSITSAMDYLSVAASPFYLGRIDVFLPKSNRSVNLASYANKISNLQAPKILVSGVPGVTDVDTETSDIAASLAECYRVVGQEKMWRFRLNRAILNGDMLRVEDAVRAMMKVFPGVKFDHMNNYFYVRHDSNPKSILVEAAKEHPEWFKLHFISIEMDQKSVSALVPSLLSDHRFDAKRCLFNSLHPCYYSFGVEFSMQWCTYELRSVSEKNTDFHTHHPILERNFSMGFPTPVTEKGNRERDAGVLPSITFGKGEDTLRRAALEQTMDPNDNVYSCHNTGTPAPFGSNLRLGIKYPQVSFAGEIAKENEIEPYFGAVAMRMKKPEYRHKNRDFTKDLPISDRDIPIDMDVEDFELAADEPLSEIPDPVAPE